MLLGQPWCILAARGNSHGDGSSERAVRAAGESGDGHDGPQLHPALSAGSPKGSWALAPRACPETLPQPRCPCAAHNPDPLQPTRPLDLPSHPRGAFPRHPPRLFPLPALSSRHACPFPGTLWSLAALGGLILSPLPRPLLPLSLLMFTLVRTTTLRPSTTRCNHFIPPSPTSIPTSSRLPVAHVSIPYPDQLYPLWSPIH